MVGRVSKRIRAPVKTGDFAAHITRNWGRRESLFERLFDLVSYQVI